MVVGCLVAEHIRQVKTETLYICYGIIHFSDSDLMNICGFTFGLFRLTESWSYQTNRKTWRRTTSWRDTGPGAAPLSQSQLSVGSAGSGCSVWPGGGASPPACWTPSGSFVLINIWTNQKVSSAHTMFSYTYEICAVPSIHFFFFSWDFQEHVYFWQSPDQRRDCLLWPHTRRQTLCYEVLQHTSFPRLQLCGVKLWTILKFILTDFSTVGHVLRLNKLQPTKNFVLISFQLYNYMCCCLLLNVSDMGCFNLVFMFSIKCPQKFFWVLPRLATVVLLKFLQWFPDIFQDKYGQMFKWMYFYGWLRPDAACTVLGK